MATKVSISFIANTAVALDGINKVYAATKKLSSQAHSMGQGLTNFGQSMVRNVTLPIAAGLGLAAKEALEFDKQLLGSTRALDFTNTQAKEFAETAKTIAPSLGLAPSKFLELATTAGRLGVARENVVEFAKNITELGFATDTSANFLSEKFAAIRAVFGSTNKDLKILGASINALDDKIGGTSRDIVSFTARLAGVGKVAGFNSSEVAALGSTFLKLGVSVNAAGTGANTLLLNLSSATSLSKKAQSAFNKLGLSAAQVEQMMRTDPKKGLIQFLEIASNFKGDKLGTLNAIFGKQHGFKIVSLAESYQELSRAFGVVGDRSAALAKLQSETEKRLNSSSGRIAVFRAQMSSLGITLGTALLPALNSILRTVTPLIQGFAMWAETNPELLRMGLIIAGLVAVIAPLLVGIGSVITAVGAIAPVAAVVVKVIGLVIAAIGALVGSPIALVLGAIAAVVASGWWLVNNWEMVGSYLGNLWAGIQTNASNLWQAFINDPVAQAAVRLWNNAASGIVNSLVWVGDSIKWLIHRFYELPNQANQATNYLLQVFNNFFTKTIPNLFSQVGNWFMDAGKYLMLTFARGIQSKINEALRPIIDFTNRVRAYLPSSDAKVGALSTLTEAGRALLDTVAMGINDRNLVNAVALGSQNTRDAIAFGGQPTPTTAGNTITFNFSPNINVGNNADAQNIVEQLEPYARELLELLERSQNRINRGSF